LYADDLVVFIDPIELDLRVVRAIMDMFADISGLHTNVSKCQMTPICCSNDQVSAVQSWFLVQVVHFPCKYLWLPLSLFTLKNTDLMPLVDAMADRLPSWKANFMSKAGHTTLTKVTLSAIPIHISITVAVSPWICHAIDRVHRSFVWTGASSASGSKCMVAWTRIVSSDL
jgi:hypothetical protein